MTIKKEMKIKFENYLDIFLTRNQIIKNSKIYIGAVDNIMKRIINDILTKTSSNRRDLSNKLKVNKITLDTWINGFYPFQVDKVFEILELWKKSCNKSDKEYKEKLDLLFEKVEFYVARRGTRIKLPKYLTPELLYFIGYLYGDGCISGLSSCEKSEFALRFEDEYKTHLEGVVVPIAENLFGRKCKISKHSNSNSYNFRIQSKVLHFFVYKIFEMPLGKKLNNLKVPVIIKKLPLELKKSFIRGLFDSDGYVTNVEKFDKKIKDTRVSFFQKSEPIVNWVRNELEKEGIPFGNKVYKDTDGFLMSTTKKETIINFHKKLDFLHPVKKERLEKVVGLLNKGWYSSINRYNPKKAKRILKQIKT